MNANLSAFEAFQNAIKIVTHKDKDNLAGVYTERAERPKCRVKNACNSG